MQRFPCPFCGPRDEREFRYAGEAGKVRPDTAKDISDSEWREYQFAHANPIGRAAEIWVHVPCQEYFIMSRNTSTMEVLETKQLRKDVS